MKKNIQTVLLDDALDSDSSDFQGHSFLMGGTLVVLNLLLMSFVWVYWTNTDFHQYFSGRPL